MLNKQSIVAALGEQGLALPQLVNEALAANDRLKYRLTLLQLAARHAEAPDALLPDLRDERLAAQMDMVSLDDMPAQCRRLASGKYELPVLPRVRVAELRRLLEDKAFDVGPMRAELGVVPIGLAEGMRRTFAG